MATTMTLAAIVFCQVGMVLNCRTSRLSILKVGIFSNKKILWGVAVEIALICALSYAPFLHDIFNTAPLALKDWIMLIMLPPLVVAIEEVRKSVTRKYAKKTPERKATL